MEGTPKILSNWHQYDDAQIQEDIDWRTTGLAETPIKITNFNNVVPALLGQVSKGRIVLSGGNRCTKCIRGTGKFKSCCQATVNGDKLFKGACMSCAMGTSSNNCSISDSK